MKTSLIFLCLVVSVGLANAMIQNKSNPEKPAEIILSTAQGSTSFTYPPSPYGGDLPVYSSWNWADGGGGSYSLISLVENGLPDSLWMGFEDYYSWGANGVGPYERWDDYYNVGLPPNRVLWDSGTNTFGGFPWENGSLSTNIPNIGFFSRNSMVTVQLKTGGKSNGKNQSLFVITASVTGYQGLTPNEVNVPQPSDSFSISSQSIQVAGKSLGPDGLAYAVFPDNSTVDITPQAHANYYSFSVSASKHTLTITANGNDLETTTPEFCVGQQITFSPSWDSDPGAASTIAHWHLPGEFVNESYAYSSVCTSYRLNSDLLTNLSTSCWYVNEPGGTASIGMNLQFSNGQTASIAAKGGFTLVKPTIDHMTSSCSGVNMFTNSDGSLNEIALLDMNRMNGMVVAVFVKRPDHFSGSAFITQLIKRQLNWNIPPLGIPWSDSTSGNFWLDTEEQYSLSLTSFPLTENGHPANPLRPVNLYDSPGLGEPALGFYSYAEAQDDFHDYVRFQPDGGIPITIGRVDWGWHGKATKSGGMWSLVTATYYGPTLDSSDDAFPVWPYIYTGTSGN